ncbi:hypothetical protein scyTo_0013523, partial [Scyliorhinus torazame]|nr:hypothetical protein [Scyliorhinus torazame]
PEILEGKAVVPETDIWAVGVLTFTIIHYALIQGEGHVPRNAAHFHGYKRTHIQN